MNISSEVNRATLSTLAVHTQAQQIITDKLAKSQALTSDSNRSAVNTDVWVGNKWQSLQPGITRAIDHLEVLVGRLGAIRTQVETLLFWQDKAATASTSALSDYVGYFDNAIRDLNSVASTVSQIPNLIGPKLDTDLTYVQNFDYDRASVADGDFSTDYYIVDSGNNIWRKDDAAFGTTLTQYDSSGVVTGLSAAVTRDVRLDSLSGSTVGFTLYAGAANQVTVTGATLVTSGLGIQDSWLYSGLATSSGRALANTQLQKALVSIDAKLASVRTALSVARYDSGIAEINASAAKSSISSTNLRQMIELQDSDAQFERDSLALSVAVDRNRSLRAAYLGLLRSRPLGSLIDVQG